eukprot:m.285411 g.285411  ORF g.285411 m.285411 type:complete len:533 (-) comp19433_c1_seq11:1738-3336(-)
MAEGATQAATAVCIGWFVIAVVDFLLGLTCGRRYSAFLATRNIELGLGQLRLRTIRFNRYFFRLGRFQQRCWAIWFGLGTIVGVVAMVLAPVVLVVSLWSSFQLLLPHLWAVFVPSGHDGHHAAADATMPVAVPRAASSGGHPSRPVLTAIVPGVTVPLSHFGYLFLTIVVSALLHEMGHAVAAVVEGVRVQGFGAFVFFIYPGAFVELHPIHLGLVRPIQQLRIYCAGVWHNTIVLLVALILTWNLPGLLLLAYDRGDGLAVADVAPQSPLRESLADGDVITSIDFCTLQNGKDWMRCLNQSHVMYQTGRTGLCVPSALMASGHVSWTPRHPSDLDCCADSAGHSYLSSHLCFQAAGQGAHPTRGDGGFSCLPVRQVIATSAVRRCSQLSDCNSDHFCANITAESLSTRLLAINRKDGWPVLFFGSMGDVYRGLTLSEYVPRSEMVHVAWPAVIDTSLRYLSSISAAFAVLNMLPTFSMDGEFAFGSLLRALELDEGLRERVEAVTTKTCGALLSTTLVAEFIKLWFRRWP